MKAVRHAAWLLALSVIPQSAAFGATQTIELVPGWNLVSLQVEPYEPAITTPEGTGVLDPISGSFDEVWTYETLYADPPLWLGYQPSGPTQTLSEIRGGAGYWMHIGAYGSTKDEER